MSAITMDYRDFRILHPHGNERIEMSRQPHDAANGDVERKWGKGAVFFKCTRCEEGIVILPPTEAAPKR
jgi:hypothetical protein